jgi:RHS repeat-associated protein
VEHPWRVGSFWASDLLVCKGPSVESTSCTEDLTATSHGAPEPDSETGLYYYRARYYDPTGGRFLGEDPIGFRGGINKYVYVRNQAPNRLDTFGTQCEPCIDPNGLQRLVISILQPLSHAFGFTLGIGVGGSIGGGPPIIPGTPGFAGSGVGASRQLVVSPNGQAGITTSISVGVALGFGGYAGPQVSLSNAPTPADLGGPFVGGSYGGGDIVGGGADVNFGKGTTDPNRIIWQGTFTGGIGVGGKGSGGGGSVTSVEPICDLGHLW